jgi:hypothetical protein
MTSPESYSLVQASKTVSEALRNVTGKMDGPHLAFQVLCDADKYKQFEEQLITRMDEFQPGAGCRALDQVLKKIWPMLFKHQCADLCRPGPSVSKFDAMKKERDASGLSSSAKCAAAKSKMADKEKIGNKSKMADNTKKTEEKKKPEKTMKKDKIKDKQVKDKTKVEL